MSLHLLGRTDVLLSGVPSSSGANHREFPGSTDVPEVWVTFSECSTEWPKSVMQAVPSPRMRTFDYNWHINQLRTISRRFDKLTPVKSPWMTFLSWTTRSLSYVWLPGTSRLTHDIANQQWYLQAGMHVSFLPTALQTWMKTDNLVSSNNLKRKTCILTLQVGFQVSILRPKADYGNEWAEARRVAIYR